MTEQENRTALKEQREDWEKHHAPPKNDDGEQPGLEAAVSELVTELRTERVARSKAPALARSSMTAREKSAFVKANGADKFLALPWK